MLWHRAAGPVSSSALTWATVAGGYGWQRTNPWGLRDGDRPAIPHELVASSWRAQCVHEELLAEKSPTLNFTIEFQILS